MTSFSRLPQRQVLVTNCLQMPHDPVWHCWVHLCLPQAKGLSHVPPQVGTSSVQGNETEVCPQGHFLCPVLGQSPQLSAWHTLSHRWWPHDKTLLQTCSHCHSGLAQGLLRFILPHWQLCKLSLGQGKHSPEWHGVSQLWWPQNKRFPHGFPHDHNLALQRLTTGGCAAQWQDTRTVLGQGGQGPGWQSSRQSWPQSGLRGLLQDWPQECGVSHGSKEGFSCFPQKQ